MVPFNENKKKLSWIVISALMVIPNFISVPIWIQLIFNSVAAVSLGALYSITIKSNSQSPETLDRMKSGDKDSETMSMADALKFPLQASSALLLLYILFNSIDNNLLLYVFKFNFCCLGFTCLSSFFLERVHLLFPKLKDVELVNRKLRILGEEVHLHLSTYSVIAYLGAGIVNLLYITTDHWILNNILGITFTIAGIMLLKVPNFKIILVLLWVLFFYDIFWVFASDVMVTVAIKFDVPIKLKFPNNEGKFSILGLGDMVIPGIILALSLKFDVDTYLAKLKDSITTAKSGISKIETPIYFGALIGYFIGIVMTIVSMYCMNHPQPALLFLVPACTLGILIPIIATKRLKSFWNYDSEVEIKEKQKEK